MGCEVLAVEAAWPEKRKIGGGAATKVNAVPNRKPKSPKLRRQG